MKSEGNSFPTDIPESSQTILEIGPRNIPLYEMSDVLQGQVEAGSRYIAADLDEAALHTLEGNKVYEHAVVADARNLPFSNNSLDQVWLMNVFSGTSARAIHLPDGTTRLSTDLSNVLNELARVLKPNGKAIIGELYYRGDPASLDWLMHAKPPGLDTQVFVDDTFKDFIDAYKINPAYLQTAEAMSGHGRPFFVVLTKPQN